MFKVNDRTDLWTWPANCSSPPTCCWHRNFYTEFDWRVGILNKTPLFVCQYFMSKEHWQIYNHEPGQRLVTALAISNLPGRGCAGGGGQNGAQGGQPDRQRLIRRGLKQTAKGVVVIEVNDNPNIDHGIEDAVLKENLYRTIVEDIVWRAGSQAGKIRQAGEQGSRKTCP